jgi:YVTN family beta-propeller protein
VYVANHNSNTVAVIDGAGDSIVAAVAVGNGPRALCYCPTHNKVYCANSSDSSVTVIDGDGDSVVTTVLVRHGPCALCYNPTYDKVYCADSGSGKVSVISGADDSVVATVATGPWSLCYNPTNNKVYGTLWGPNQVAVIDGTTNLIIATVQLMRDEPMACLYDPLDNKVYVACRGDMGSGQGVSVIDGASNDTIRTIATDYGSWDLCLNPVQNRVYVANRDNPTISVIRDSMSGIAESPKPQALSRKLAATVLSGASGVGRLASCVVFDAMGRRVANPRSGICFVREQSAVGGKPSAVAVRKVVIQR